MIEILILFFNIFSVNPHILFPMNIKRYKNGNSVKKLHNQYLNLFYFFYKVLSFSNNYY